MIGAALTDTATLAQELADTRSRLNIPAGSPLPIGVGFIGWLLDGIEASNAPQLIPTLAQMPKVIWLSFGADLNKYVTQIRAYDAKRSFKTSVWVLVNSVDDALIAANTWKVDGIVVQGIEAGGHGGSEAPPLFILLQAVRSAIPANGPLIIAAGGAATGPQIAALLTMGADAVAMGTRFLTTNECAYSPTFKAILQKSSFNDTTRSFAWDIAEGSNFFPPKINGRAITNKIIDDFNEGLSLEEMQARFAASAATNSTERAVIWAGIAVGLTHDMRGATELVQSLTKDALASLKAGALLVTL